MNRNPFHDSVIYRMAKEVSRDLAEGGNNSTAILALINLLDITDIPDRYFNKVIWQLEIFTIMYQNEPELMMNSFESAITALETEMKKADEKHSEE